MSGLGDVRAEVDRRVERLQERLLSDGLDAVVVYGNVKVSGNLRYLTDFYLDRVGWVSAGPGRQDVTLFEGAAVVVPARGQPVLLIELGHIVDIVPAIRDIRGGGLTAGGAAGLDPAGLESVLRELGATGRVGIETWDRFPAPLFVALRERMPTTAFEPSTRVEELRLVKSPFEIEMHRKCGEMADAGHTAFVEALTSGRRTELELVRIAEAAMRDLSPTYEDAVPAGPSKICSGTDVLGMMLHSPLPDKVVDPGDIVNWDICGRYRGYVVDTSRTRMLGAPTPTQQATYDVVLEMGRAVREAARPGAVTTDLVRLADDIAQEHGHRLWAMFLGHGIGLDCHERPDMGVEDMVLEENMVITVEPRLVADDRYLLANEDMVLVTPDGGVPFESFPRGPLQVQ